MLLLPTPSYNPKVLSNCTLWLPYSGDTASVWTDKAGSSRNFSQSTGSLQPSITKGVPTFDGVDDVQQTSVALSTIFGAGAKTLFLVFNAISSPTDNAISYTNAGVIADSVQYFGIFIRSSGKVCFYNWDGNEDKIELSYTLNTKVLVTMTHDGVNMTGAINAGAATSVATGNTQVLTGAVYLGRGGLNVYLNCKIYEVVAYNRVLTAAELLFSKKKLLRRHQL